MLEISDLERRLSNTLTRYEGSALLGSGDTMLIISSPVLLTLVQLSTLILELVDLWSTCSYQGSSITQPILAGILLALSGNVNNLPL